jgi:hypothetical protein
VRYDHSGTSVAGGADVDGDGYSDPIVGAPDNSTAGSGRGAAHVVYGATDGVDSTGGLGVCP